MVALHPVEGVVKLLHRRVATLRSGRNCRRGNTSLSDTQVVTALVDKLGAVDFGEEQNTAAGQTEACFVHHVLSYGPTPCRHVGETDRRLSAVIRKSRKRRVDVVQKVDDATEGLIVPDVFNVMVLHHVEVKANRREATSLA